MGQKDGDKGCARQKDGDKDAWDRKMEIRMHEAEITGQGLTLPQRILAEELPCPLISCP